MTELLCENIVTVSACRYLIAQAQGPLRFSDDERRSFEGKASFDALSLSTPVHVRLPTSTEQDPGTEPGDAAPGVIVAKIEVCVCACHPCHTIPCDLFVSCIRLGL